MQTKVLSKMNEIFILLIQIWVFCYFLDGWAGNLVPGSHNLDRKFRCGGSLAWLNRTPSIRCLEWWQEVSHKIWGWFWGGEKANKYCTICSHPRRPPKVAQRILQGIYSVAICGNHCTDIGCILCASADAGCKLSATLVRYRIYRFIFVVVILIDDDKHGFCIWEYM